MEKEKPIIALDLESKEKARTFLKLFSDEKLNVKIGMELFYSSGPNFVKEIVEAGHEVFLDLKLYDIPNTVKQAMTQLARLGVSMVNVHASGGIEMMQAANEGLKAGMTEGKNPPLLIAVTQLTSREDTTNVYEQQLAVSQEESILHLARLTDKSQLAGVVCSPLEAARIKKNTHIDFLTVTPGIRLASQTLKDDDQVRITTPKQAATNGSDYIVVGRPITQAQNPVQAYQTVLQEWQNALKGDK
jgi:orotidine-5'-phosphate decarboxylase